MKNRSEIIDVAVEDEEATLLLAALVNRMRELAEWQDDTQQQMHLDALMLGGIVKDAFVQMMRGDTTTVHTTTNQHSDGSADTLVVRYVES